MSIIILCIFQKCAIYSPKNCKSRPIFLNHLLNFFIRQQRPHLDRQPEKVDKSFRIVLMHRSAYPLNYNEEEIRALAPVFEECNVDLVLSGHDHIYSRTTMLAGEKTAMNTNGVTYVVTGSASGSKYYAAADDRPW